MIGLNLLVRYIKLQVCMYATLRVARHKRYTLFEINSGREIQSPNINLAGLIKAQSQTHWNISLNERTSIVRATYSIITTIFFIDRIQL